MITNYQNLKVNIDNAIQNSGLDIGGAYFVVKDTLRNLEALYYATLNKELEAMNNQNNEENNECNNE